MAKESRCHPPVDHRFPFIDAGQTVPCQCGAITMTMQGDLAIFYTPAAKAIETTGVLLKGPQKK